MQQFRYQHRDPHISKHYLNTVVQKIPIFRLELQRWPFEIVISTVCTMVFGIEVWLISYWDHVIKISIKGIYQ